MLNVDSQRMFRKFDEIIIKSDDDSEEEEEEEEDIDTDAK
jgi:hypothetical protein